jgi:hypothetical protein
MCLFLNCLSERKRFTLCFDATAFSGDQDSGEGGKEHCERAGSEALLCSV